MNKKLSIGISMLVALISLNSCNKVEKKSDAYGNFEAIEVTVSAQATGQLLQLQIEEGQHYSKDVPLGIIDTTDMHLKRLQSISQYTAVLSKLATINAQAEAQEQQLQNLAIDKERINKLFVAGAATQKQRDDIDGAFALAKKQLAATLAQKQNVAAEAEVVQTQKDQVTELIRKCYITQPIGGIVLTKFAESGEVVTFGKPLYKVADLSTLDLKAYISGHQLIDFALGQEVEVVIDKSAAEEKVLKGKVSWIASNAEFTPKIIQTKEERVDLVYAMKVKVKNDGSLKIGMPGEIRIIH